MDTNYKSVVALWAAALVAAMLLIPLALVNPIQVELEPSSPPYDVEQIPAPQVIPDFAEDHIFIPVYLTAEDRIETVPLEQYVRGVLAAEMPIDFELEALKAQAIAARTYILRRLYEQDDSHVPVAGALVTDSVSHQVYYSESKLEQIWDQADYTSNLRKINRAIEETKDMIITYDGQPINATFFSTSNGFTENSEEYWDIALPYLRSVPSPWDVEISPRYEETVSFPARTVFSKLGISQPIAQTSSGGQTIFTIIERTAGQRIKTVNIGGEIFTGREVREKLGLNSSQFILEQSGDTIVITTYGYGHGVGMSQWGANGMAQAGRTAEEIITHYYQGVEIEKIEYFQNI